MKRDLRGDLVSARGCERACAHGCDVNLGVYVGVNVGLSVYVNVVCKRGHAYRAHVITMSTGLQMRTHLRTLCHQHFLTVSILSKGSDEKMVKVILVHSWPPTLARPVQQPTRPTWLPLEAV